MTAAAGAPDELKPYLQLSLATHGAVVALALLGYGFGGAVPPEVYRIDFIGPTQGIANRELEAAAGQPAPRAAAPAPPAAKPPPMRKADDFAKPKTRAPLPRPSFLGPDEPAKPQTQASPEPAPAPAVPAPPGPPAASPGSGGAASGPPTASLSFEMPNFPYPWYISQVRSQLWARWSARMPDASGSVVIMFTILKTGALTDLRVEQSSGDEGYDYAALTAVQESAPFAPLPPGFKERFLKVHVKFFTH